MDDIAPYLDAELVEMFRALPRPPAYDSGSQEDLSRARASMDQWVASIASLPVPPGIVREERDIPGPEGAPNVRVRVYAPASRSTILPGLVWMHGGGFVAGSFLHSEHTVQALVEQVGCVAVSVDYRLAPEHPFPAGLEDCYAALRWLAASAQELGVDPERIAIGGESAGGGLAAALALLSRDRGEIRVVFQSLTYPMLDDRASTPSSRDITDPRVPNRQGIGASWRRYLHAEPGSEGVSPYAAPARATDLAGLPPAYIAVGTMDLFRDDNIAYAQRLAQAMVPVELHVYPGAFHGSELMVPWAAISQQLVQERIGTLKRVLHPQRAAQQAGQGAADGFNLDSPLKDLLANVETCAILEKHLPGIIDNPQIEMARSFSLSQLAVFDTQVFNSETLNAIAADLEHVDRPAQ